MVGAAVASFEGGLENYAEEGIAQAFDPDRTGYDCGAMRAAAKRGAAAGAVAGAVAGGLGAARSSPKEYG